MQCSQIQGFFSEYADHELDVTTANLLKHHLQSCNACKYEWEAFQQTIFFLHAIPAIEPPSDLLFTIHKKLNKPTLLQRWRDWLRNLDLSMSIPAATATVSIALVSALVFKHITLESHNHVPDKRETVIAQSIPPVQQKIYRNVVTIPRFTNSTTAQALATRSFRNIDKNHNMPQQLLAAHAAVPPNILSRRYITPDMIITTLPTSSENLFTLFQYLQAKEEWQIYKYTKNQLLIKLQSHDLPELHQTLIDNNIKLLSRYRALSSHEASTKPELTVMIHLR